MATPSRQPRVRPCAGVEAFHQGVGVGDRPAGLFTLVGQGVGAGGDGGGQGRRRGGSVPGGPSCLTGAEPDV
ncbi:hypothetical protein [Embleya sp. NPDC050493]|uniref:hypothetical protein n=1 Tax=Embleya sp. NPDC050493 TaxID=3363989 RepID=UPI003799FFC5